MFVDARLRADGKSLLGLHSTTCRGDAPACAGLVGGPLSRMMMDVHVCSSVWHGSRGASGAFSLDRGRQVYLWCCDRNLGQILRDYQRQMESPPIIGFFYGVIGH